LKGLSQSGVWPSGNPRFYLRKSGQKAIAMPDLPKSDPRFLAAWLAATGPQAPTDRKPLTGTIGALCVAYMASAAYQNLAHGTRGYMRLHIEAIRKTWGTAQASTLEAKHIRADLAKMQPHPANTRLKAWKAMCKWAFNEAALLDANPAAAVAKRVTPRSDGFTPWDRADVAAFRAYWPHHTQQRMAFEVMHRTGAAIGDACEIGPAMVRDGWLHYRRGKTESPAVCPMTAEVSPSWFEHDDNLALCVAAQPRHAIWIVTQRGASKSHQSASQWFARACRAAGLAKGKTAHGIRKHRAQVFMENGATDDQRMAILGHETKAEARRYSAGASLVKTVSGTWDFQLPPPASNFRADSQ
jgi:site-specific recombinase XerD